MRRKYLFTMILFIMSLLFSTLVIHADDLSGFTAVAENQYSKLLIDQSTTEIAVLDKETNNVWYSNPNNLDRNEKIARGKAKKSLHSQVEINFFAQGDEPRVMDNYNDSVLYNQFKITELENGVRIDYTLGKEWDDDDFVPVMISKERFEKLILDKIDDTDDRDFVKQQYVLVSLEKKTTADEETDSYSVDIQKLFGDYILKSHDEDEDSESEDDFFFGFAPQKLDQKGLIDLLTIEIIKNRKDVTRRDQLKNNDVKQLINTPTYVLRDTVAKWDFADMLKLIKETGYKPEDVQKDHAANNLDIPLSNQTIFHIPVEYLLEGKNFIATIPVNQIKYPIGVLNDEGEKVTYPLHAIEFLKYFGAADQKAKGYMLVPDGTGALINLNNNKTYAKPYDQLLYGIDHAIKPWKEKMTYLDQSYLPVYGLKEANKSFLAIIEKGDAIAAIKASISGVTSSYNTVAARFTTIPKSKVILPVLDAGANELPNEINIYQTRLYNDDIKIRYNFLGEEDANYVGMAKSYQKYLQQQGLKQIISKDDIPFYLEVVGSIDKKDFVMGAPKTVIQPLTKFSESKEILTELLEGNINNIKVRYTGSLKGGIEHYVPSGFSLEKKLGGKQEFVELHDFMKENNLELYVDVNFLNIYHDKFFDGFRASKDASRYINRSVAKIYDYNIANYQYNPNDFAYILSPSKLDNLVGKFLSDYQRYDIDVVSLREMGRQLNSDYVEDPQKLVDRQGALEIIKNEMRKIDEEYKFNIMVNGGNAFVLPFVDHILNMPTSSNRYNIIDKTIPFYQIALHGFVNYAAKPFNFSNDYQQNILMSLETGASPYYKWSYSENSLLKGTDYDHLYSLYYGDWIDEAFTAYHEVNDILKDVQNYRIIAHTELSSDVYQTTYEDGTSIIVNYNQVPVMINGFEIVGEGYKVLKEGK